MRVLFSDTSGYVQGFDDQLIDLSLTLLIQKDRGIFEYVVGKHGYYPLSCVVYGHPSFLLRHREDIVHAYDASTYLSILGMNVITKSGKRLGRVLDFTFDTESFDLIDIFVAKRFLWFSYGRRIIPKEKILLMKKDVIVVKEDTVKVRDRVKEPAMEISPA